MRARCLGRACSSDHKTGSKAEGRPNIVFVLTDDLDSALLTQNPGAFPNIEQLAEAGTSFSNYFVSNSLCCPSRATMLRGQYAHNTGVLGNAPPHGGFERFHKLGDERSTIATWLHAAGYATGLFGKYLNGYPNTVAQTYVPPGWDQWVSATAAADTRPYFGFDYALNINGRKRAYGHAADDYLGDVLANATEKFIRQESGHRPFFAYVAPWVPHAPAIPPPWYAQSDSTAALPRTPSFDERDATDKPQFLRDTKPLTSAEIGAMRELYQLRIESMRGVDDLLGRVVKTLRNTGQLSNTYVVFTSDNGFHMGQHRLKAGKLTAYEEDIRVPFVVRGPGVPAARTVSSIVLNSDLAPTFAALAGGGRRPSSMVGRSFPCSEAMQCAGPASRSCSSITITTHSVGSV